MASYIATWEPGYRWALEEWLKAQETGEWNGGPFGYENNMVTGACTVKLGVGIEETLPPEVLQQYNDTYEAIMNGEIVPVLDISLPESE